MNIILKAAFISGFINTSKAAHLKASLKKIPGLVKLARLCKVLVSPSYRSVWRLKHSKPENLFQPYGTTKHDRCPGIFTFVREQLSGIASPRILSFGCSTGEEVFTLREYFPQAGIVGIDINPHSIAVCRKRFARTPDSRIRFKLANSPAVEPESFYDAVFCMSVLRHGDLGASNAQSCAHLIRFADFEKTVAGFCRCLKPGGYLVIRGSNFRFTDTATATGFEAVFSVEAKFRADTPLYGLDNRRLPDIPYNDVVFLKRAEQ